MADNIYDYLKENFNINVTDYQFKRDYIKEPLRITSKYSGSGKYAEKPYKEDLEYLLLKLNLSRNIILKLFNRSKNTLNKWIKLFNITISKDSILKKRKQTNLDRYGVENLMLLNSVKEKIKQTCLQKYGVENQFQNEQIKDKIKKTNLKKYGKTSYTQTDEYINKKIQTNMKKYGVPHHQNLPYIKEKAKKTNLDRYGVICYTKTDEYINKTIQTNLKKYNRKWSNQRHITNKNLNIINDKQLLEQYIIDNNILNGEELSKHLGIGEPMACRYIRKYNLHNMFDYSKSVAEKEIREYINQYYETSNNDRQVIKPYELDIYIPELNKAIEYNGDYWHNISESVKNKDLIKQTICKQKGIDLLVIWEHEYNTNKEEVYKRIDEFIERNI